MRRDTRGLRVAYVGERITEPAGAGEASAKVGRRVDFRERTRIDRVDLRPLRLSPRSINTRT